MTIYNEISEEENELIKPDPEIPPDDHSIHSKCKYSKCMIHGNKQAHDEMSNALPGAEKFFEKKRWRGN